MKKRLHNIGWALAFLLASFILCFAFATKADAAYKVHLKNGSVITGVSHYEKSDGEVMLYLEVGVIGVPEADILKIEAGKDTAADVAPQEKQAEEKTAPSELDADRITPESYKSEKPVEAERSELEKVTGEIEKKEAELKKTEEELQTTMVRIQATNDRILSLEKRILALTGKTSLSEQEKALLLQLRAQLAQEKSIIQQNVFKKRKLEDDKKKLEEELKALYAEKQRLGG